MNKTIKITIAVILLGIYLISMIGMVSALTITAVNTNPEEIAPGETASVSIRIENEQGKDVEDVSVILDLIGPDIPFAPYDSSSEYSIDEIEDDDSEYAEFEIIALSDAQSGIYKIPLIINYQIDGKAQPPKNSLIGISVNAEPIISASVEDGLLLKPQENEINIKIVNKGLSDVKFLEVELASSTYYNILSSENVYIGDVDSDDFDSAEFKIFFKANAPSSINLPVTIIYKDALNKKYIEDFDLRVKVYTRKKAIELGLLEKNNIPMYTGIIIGLIIIFFGYKKIKKRRKLKKAAQSAMEH